MIQVGYFLLNISTSSSLEDLFQVSYAFCRERLSNFTFIIVSSFTMAALPPPPRTDRGLKQIISKSEVFDLKVL